jgi:hypothetical protein
MKQILFLSLKESHEELNGPTIDPKALKALLKQWRIASNSSLVTSTIRE